MRKADIISALFLLVVGLIMIFVVIPFQTYPGERYGVPPATVPTAAMAVVVLMAAILLVQRLLEARRGQATGPKPMPLRSWVHITGYTALLFAGLAAIKCLHFIPGGILILALLMPLTGQRKPLTIVLVAVPIPFLVYAALWYGLRMPLP
jgi:Tripartite tricarboxylate transporter TctB family